MSESEKREFSKEKIKGALTKSKIEFPQNIDKLNVSYICDRIILESQDGKYKYSNSVMSGFFLELGFTHQEVFDCNYRDDFKKLFLNGINIQTQDGGSIIKMGLTKVSNKVLKPHSVPSRDSEKQEIPKTFDEAVNLYHNICSNDGIETFNQNCDVSRDINVYFTDSFEKKTGVAITKSDGIWIAPPLQVNTDFFVLVPFKSNSPVIWGSLIKGEKEGKYYLCTRSENVRIGDSDANINYKIVVANKEFTRFFEKEIKVFSKLLPVADEVLCIDFGTSNTTAGTWVRTKDGVKSELVHFDDVTKPGSESAFLPTIVYLKDMKSEENRFLFGFEAKKHIIDNDFNPKGNIFYNIKQWIVADDDFRIETGSDECGEECERYNLFAKDIIIEYIKYVIINAEIKLKRKCKRLHFSAPVKCKDIFITFLTERFQPWKKDYEILPANESLDEAIAIIYKRISEIKTEFEEGEKESGGELMVIDCGGGTTDAASCSYLFAKTDTGTKIEITTKFENGQTAFGGNDLTYRIFQFLKIRLKDYYIKKYAGENLNENNTKEIFDSITKFPKINVMTRENEEEDFFSHIDSYIIMKRNRFDCYDKLDNDSKLAEQIIPTDFGNKEIVGDGSNIREQARRNFNYLWQLAEQWKIALYSSEDSKFDIDFKDETKVLRANLENIGFYINKDALKDFTGNNNGTKQVEALKGINRLELEEGIPDIKFNREELITLLEPQIYYLLSVMFLKPDGTDRKELPKKIRFSGQSCRIGAFQDMLKEFVPGRALRGGTTIETAERKKLACVEGCIQYLSDKAYGKVIAELKLDTPNILYTVAVDRGGKSLETLLAGGEICKGDGMTYMPEITLHKRELIPGWIRLNILNNLTKENCWRDIVVKAFFPDGRDLENSEQLKEEIRQNAPADFDQWEIVGTGAKVLDRLIEQLKYSETIDKLFIFAIPNKDGFTFTLWQILKYRSKADDGQVDIEKFRVMGSERIQYQKIEFATYFDGQNCK